MKKIRNLNQFLAGFNQGDAISNEALAIQKHLQTLGIGGEIFSEHISASSRRFAKKFNRYTPSPGDLVLYHHSIHSNVLDFFKSIDLPKWMIYHNVTPHHYFESYDLRLTYYLKRGRDELIEAKNSFSVVFADSAFNRQELLDIGFSEVTVLPIIMDYGSFSLPNSAGNDDADSKSSSLGKTKKKKILFVGRIAPNKKQDDLIRFAKIFREIFHEEFELHLVGYCSKELLTYKEELEKMVDFFGLHEFVFFHEFVSQETLVRCYQNSDLFLSMSEHEGFCVPLLESMNFDVPILAFAKGAVPETLGGSGVLFHEKDFPRIAGMAYQIFESSKLRYQILQKQRQRFQDFVSLEPIQILVQKLREHYEI